MNKIALITGATSGIGAASAKILANNGYDVIITGRRNERLSKLKVEIENESKSRVLCLCFDIRDGEIVKNKIASLDDYWSNIDLLVNNAGLAAGLSTVHDGLVDDWERMIDTNVKGLLYISKAVSNIMINRNSGQIINISSIAGREAYPLGNVYCGTKHAVNAITKSMRIELVPFGIKVCSIAPGMVNTEFSLVRFSGDNSSADNVYKGFDELSAEDIAETLLFVANRPKHVCIDDLLIMPTAQASVRDVHKEL